MTVLATGVVVIVLVLAMTSQGRNIDAAVQRFMLYYAGVFALIGLTASVGVGLVATDRIVMTPGHRVMAQAIHRAVSFGALTFLIVHIVTEILAQRVHVIDAVVPFLSPFRTFYIGLGTIASDLIILLVITSIFRKRFTAHGKAWRWRAIHYCAYLSFVFGVMHGLLGGRAGKPYVDWSYGAAIALVAFGIAVRFLAISLRPKESLPVPPVTGKSGTGASPLHAASLAMTQAHLGGTIQMLPIGTGMQGMQPAGMGLPSATALQLPPGSSYGGYGDGGYTPLGAPPYGDGSYGGMSTHPYQQPALASLPAPPMDSRQPMYEPGYIGPPRYEGAPRNATGPMPRIDSGPMPRAGTGPRPRMDTGPMPRGGTGPRPQAPPPGPPPGAPQLGLPQPGAQRQGTGPIPQAPSGPMSRPGTGPMPPYGNPGPVRGGTGPMAPPPGLAQPAPPNNGRRPDRRPDESWDRDRPQHGGGAWR